MFGITHHRLLGIVACLILSVALVAAGFGHRAPTGAEPALDAFVLAGGDLSQICADTGGDAMAGEDCPACHLTATLLVPPHHATASMVDLRLVAQVDAPRESRALHRVRDPARGLRAPPAPI